MSYRLSRMGLFKGTPDTFQRLAKMFSHFENIGPSSMYRVHNGIGVAFGGCRLALSPVLYCRR